MFPIRTILLIAVLTCLAGSIGAQSVPNVRSIGRVESRSKMLFASVANVRVLSNGNLMVHDIRGRQVSLLNARLDSLVPVVDTTSATNRSYGSFAGGMIAWPGDSTLFVDPTTLSMLLLDSQGDISRVIAMPRMGATCFLGGPSGTPAFSARRGIICRTAPTLRAAGQPASPLDLVPFEIVDSTTLVSYNPATRMMANVATFNQGLTRTKFVKDDRCQTVMLPIINPLRVVDDWTVTSDGSIAIVRANDYHVDWIDADGTTTATKPLPRHIKRLSDEEKARYVDSTRASLAKLRDASRLGQSSSSQERKVCSTNDGGVSVPTRGVLHDPAALALAFRTDLAFVEPNELPDYVPPFASGSVRGDLDGNVWIRRLETEDRGPIYDVVNRKGELTSRVALPPGRVISGFGPGGTVYMAVKEDNGVRLERVMFTQP